jgi:hypothetical protein
MAGFTQIRPLKQRYTTLRRHPVSAENPSLILDS